MSFRQYCINMLTEVSHNLRTDYGVKSLCMFGSVARDEAGDGSDVDIYVDMPPKALKIVALKLYLQDILGRDVDIVRARPTLDPFLQREIDKDGITIFT